MKNGRIGICLLSLVLIVLNVPSITLAQGDYANYGLQTYQGQGWSLKYPANATLNVVSETEIRIAGPMIAIRPADVDFTVSGPAYEIGVTVFQNPERVFPEVWAEQKILADWKAEVTGEGPNPFPVTDEGALDPNKFESLIVADRPAAKAIFFGGDADIVHMYVGSDDMIIMFDYRADVLPNNPLAIMQLDVYALIMDTLDFEGTD